MSKGVNWNCILFLIIRFIDGSSVPDEQLLFEDLLSGYEKSVRPVENATTILTVSLGFRLNQIVDLDERHQVLTTNVFIYQVWEDENLSWDPERYNKVKSIRASTRQIWLPDTFIHNNADEGSTGFLQGTYILLFNNGTILWPVPVKLKSSCKVDISYFPFDEQECIIRLGSWIYSVRWLDYKTMDQESPVDLTSYVYNSEWDLLSVTFEKEFRNRSCCSDLHADLKYTLRIKRRTFYYIFNIIIPCVMLSVLTLLTFWLPPNSGEKITLGLSVFLAFSMFMLLIAEEVPATSEAVPLIGVYLCVVMTMTSLSVIMAVMVINLFNRGIKTKRAPEWLRTFVLSWLSKALLLKHNLSKTVSEISLEDKIQRCHCHQNDNQKQPKNSKRWKITHDSDVSNVRNRNSGHFEDSTSFEHTQNTRENIDEQKSKLMASSNQNLMLYNSRERITSVHVVNGETSLQTEVETQLGTLRCKTQNELMKRKMIVAEWQRIAIVVDRILFWFFFFGTLLSYLVILVFVPNSD